MTSRYARHGRVLTTGQAAALLGVHQRTLRRYLSCGLLTCHRLPGGHYRIPEESIAEFLHEAEVGGRRAWRQAVGADPLRKVRQSNHQRGAGVSPPRRRLRLGEESSTAPYDLSRTALSAVRSRNS
jgi:excisionase family DNA binding protein